MESHARGWKVCRLFDRKSLCSGAWVWSKGCSLRGRMICASVGALTFRNAGKRIQHNLQILSPMNLQPNSTIHGNELTPSECNRFNKRNSQWNVYQKKEKKAHPLKDHNCHVSLKGDHFFLSRSVALRRSGLYVQGCHRVREDKPWQCGDQSTTACHLADKTWIVF